MVDARHLLVRAGFGPTLEELAQYSRLGRTAAVERLLDAPATALSVPPAWINEPLVPLRSLRDAPVEQRQAFQQLETRRGFELRAWWVGEMLGSPSPLLERMTLFWHNHFTSSQQKVRYAQLMYRQNLLLRRHALGSFGELLHAVARDPAMVLYLDSASNRRDRPNENFARELLELFTLGEGQYGEKDIRETARAFTGWSIDPETAEFRFRPALHDSGEKTVLGQRARLDGDAVLDILLANPRTSRHIVEKLWREFVSPEPDAGEVNRIATVFRDSRLDIRAALRELLLSPAFWSDSHRGVLVKSPVDFVVGTLRQFDVRVTDATPFALVAASLGQNLFAPPNVKGWPGGEAWIDSASLLSRRQFVERLFRADEMRRTTVQPAMAAGDLPIAQLRARLRRAADDARFDGADWFRQWAGVVADGAFGRTATRAAAADPAQALDAFVLAVAPSNALPAGLGGRERLRLLALDPAYQLK